MARTIESPGVQINEIDLSFNTGLPVGTNIWINGFSNQGPTLELINVTSKSELEQIYGAPTTEAERYFFQSCTEVLNSPANLVCTRLPYGAGAGGGFGDTYTGLFYPVSGYEQIDVPAGTEVPGISSWKVSAVNDDFYNGGTPFEGVEFVTSAVRGYGANAPLITFDEYIDINSFTITLSTNNNVWGTAGVVTFGVEHTLDNINYELSSDAQAGNPTYFDGSINVQDGSLTLSLPGFVSPLSGVLNASFDQRVLSAITAGVTAGYVDAEYSKSSKFVIGEPVLLGLNEEEYTDIQSGQINWGFAGTNIQSSLTASNADLGYTGFIVLNKTKLSTNDVGEGYYFGVVDSGSANNDGVPIYDSIQSIQSVNKIKPLGFYELAESTLGISLTGSETKNPNSVSEQLESGFQYDFSDPSYKDALIFGLIRLRTTNQAQNDPEQLYIGYQEKWAGSLDIEDINRVNPNSLQQESFFVEKQVNDASNYIDVVVNPNISEKARWRAPDGRIGEVLVSAPAKKLYSFGQFVSTKGVNTQKVIGQVPAKLEASFLLAENKDVTELDVTVEAGLGTVFSYASIKDIQDGGDGSAPTDFDPYMAIKGEVEDLDDPNTGISSDLANYYGVINNAFSTFVSESRKDCMHISDPIRGIFIQGRDFKVVEKKDKNFSQHIYWPLKNLYSTANNNYVATYANWVKSFDSRSGNFFWSPFSGYQAAIIARMDANSQPWFAPAGLERGIVRNIVDIAINPTQKQRDLLYKVGINPVVYFPRDAYTVWGQKTLQAKPSAFDRINVRRLFLVLEKATLRLTRYFVMQPNTVFTRTRLVNYLKPIFDIAKQNEGVYDYLIVCDERNNTPDVIDRNELVLDIYIKPVRTAEFILVNFIATRTGADFNELI
jgi:hypothetical protein